MNAMPYDVVVFGATSFVGRLVCRHLAGASGPTGLKWAAAGRSPGKLEELRQQLPSAADIPLIIADATDEQALASMCAQTRVVISTVGPYALYGEPLVKVCAETGTDYCDLAGEVHWVRRMIDRYESTAAATGARIVNCCGFDSIPSDLGVHFLQREALERFGRYFTRILMRVKAMRGGISGGTAASIMNVAKEAAADPSLRRDLQNPYLLCPPDRRPTIRQENLNRPQYDAAFQSWLAPFIMAGINTRVVHRSNAVLGSIYGPDFRYDEAVLTGQGLRGRMKAFSIAGALIGFMTMSALAPTRWFLRRFVVPAPGQGPSLEAQKKGFYDLRFLGLLEDGQTLRVKVTGDADPGYGSTSKILAETGALLARGGGATNAGGFWTPATLLGDQLLETLQKRAGL
ncbi:MAG: saccharopine dehydrogenase NADP-binding domain-containing protein, partial [Alphaproteobacteria bacterium]